MRDLSDLESALERGLEVWEGKIVRNHAERMGQKIVREAKRETPVDSGNLRRRWFSAVEGTASDMVIRVSNDAEYAAPVNNGHRIVRGGKTAGFVPGRNMLEKGIQTYNDNYRGTDMENMMDELRKAIR